jgi:hypothetical protein
MIQFDSSSFQRPLSMLTPCSNDDFYSISHPQLAPVLIPPTLSNFSSQLAPVHYPPTSSSQLAPVLIPPTSSLKLASVHIPPISSSESAPRSAHNEELSNNPRRSSTPYISPKLLRATIFGLLQPDGWTVASLLPEGSFFEFAKRRHLLNKSYFPLSSIAPLADIVMTSEKLQELKSFSSAALCCFVCRHLAGVCNVDSKRWISKAIFDEVMMDAVLRFAPRIASLGVRPYESFVSIPSQYFTIC